MKTAHPNIGGWFDWCLLYLVGFEAFLVRSVCILDHLDSWNCRVDTVDMFRTAEPKTSPPWMRSETPPPMPGCNKTSLVGGQGFNPFETY